MAASSREQATLPLVNAGRRLIGKYQELNPEFFRVHQPVPAFWQQQGMCIRGKYESIYDSGLSGSGNVKSLSI
jgi:hypothetical protein